MLYTVFWATVAVVSVLFDRSGEAAVSCARYWVRWIFGSCGIQVGCEGLKNIDPEQAPPTSS